MNEVLRVCLGPKMAENLVRIFASIRLSVYYAVIFCVQIRKFVSRFNMHICNFMRSEQPLRRRATGFPCQGHIVNLSSFKVHSLRNTHAKGP